MAKSRQSRSRFRLQRQNGLVVAGSILLCVFLQLSRLPGMVLLETAPNWFLIWVVAWSVKRSPLESAIAGIAMGWIQDGLTAAHPTHAFGLALAGFLTSRIDKRRFIEEDFISAALLVFVMTLLTEGILAGQFALDGQWTMAELWPHLQRVALSSAIISSLWTPIIYVPLNLWWERFNTQMDNY